MKICLVSNLYPPEVFGGAEVVVGHLARGLQRAGHQVTVITTGRSPGVFEENGLRVHRLSVPNLYAPIEAPRKPRTLKPLWHLIDLWNPMAYALVRRLLASERSDVVHTHNLAGLSPAVWRAARGGRCRLVHTPHDYSLTCVRAVRMRPSGRLCTRLCTVCDLRARWLARLSANVDAVAAPSRFVLDRHLERGFFRNASTAIIRWGLPRLPEPSTDREPPVRFLFMGQLRAHKGVGVLLEGFARLRALDVRLDIAGDGDLAGTCHRAAQGDPRITVHGFVGEAGRAALYHLCHVGVLPSVWWEVAPMAVTEAMAHGLPVVGSRIGGIPELVEDGVTGLLARPGDAADLAARMEMLACDESLRRTLSANCLGRARELSLDKTLSALLALYAAAGPRGT